MNDAKTQYSQSAQLAGQPLDFNTALGAQHHDDPTNAASADHFTQPATITDLFSNERDNGRQYRNPILVQPVSFAADYLKENFNYEPDHSMMYKGDDNLNYIDNGNQIFDDNNELMTETNNDDNNYSEQIRCLNRMQRYFQTFTTK